MAKITLRRLAGPDHAVLTVENKGGGYRRTPCGGCPWRKDQVGQFPAEAFRLSASTAYDAAMHQFSCHESGTDKPATCAGFLLQNSVHNIGARIKGIAGGADCHTDVELFASYREMAIANGVSPDDPVLERCRADHQSALISKRG